MNALIFGRRQLGKSTLSLFLGRQTQCGVIIFDPTGQFENGVIACESLEELEEVLVSDRARTLGTMISFRPQNDVYEEFDSFASMLWNFSNYCLIVDESSQVQSASKAHPKLDRFVRLANPRRVHLIQSMHRPADAATICRSLTTDWYIFYTTLKNDLDVIEEKCGEECRELVSRLPRHHLLHWSDDHGTHELWSEPEKWFVPIKEADAPRKEQVLA